jgi:uncharacterized membrane protein YdcZ (DUF606 family)
MIPLADAAPTGTGLAIVGVILLAFVALVVGTIVLVIVLLTRKARHRPADPAPGWPTPPAGPPSG